MHEGFNWCTMGENIFVLVVVLIVFKLFIVVMRF